MKELDKAPSLAELTKLVSSHLNAAGALVTRVTEAEQRILANYGMDLPAHLRLSMPLSYSICQHTAAIDFPLVIDDTVYHPLLKYNLVFSELGIAAYLGAPVHIHDGKVIGAICALDVRKRRWSSRDIEYICQAASAADRLLVNLA